MPDIVQRCGGYVASEGREIEWPKGFTFALTADIRERCQLTTVKNVADRWERG